MLLVLSILATSGLSMFSEQQNRDKLDLTQERLDTIEKALEDYRFANGHLPCPADASLPPSAANYGIAGELSGTCTDGTPSANNADKGAVAGMVPTRSLTLPDDYAYDGWERRITYMVTAKITEIGALIEGKASAWTGDIIVKDATGSMRTRRAAYALVSHGENGHGAYLQSGSRRDANSVNVQELDNAGIDVNFNPAFDNELVMRRQTASDTDYTDIFDDVVRYKERWALMANSDSYKSQDIRNRLSLDTSFIASYWRYDSSNVYMQGFNYTKADGIEASNTLLHENGLWPVGCIVGMTISPDKMLLSAVVDLSPYMSHTVWTDKGYTDLPLPADVPTNNDGLSHLAWSPNGDFLAIANAAASSSGKKLMIYRRDRQTNELERVNVDTAQFGFSVDTSLDVLDVTWHPNSKFVAFAGEGSPNLALLRYDGVDSFGDHIFTNVMEENANSICSINDRANPCIVGASPNGNTEGVQFSSDGTKLLVVGNTIPTTKIYAFNPTGPVYLSERKVHSITDGSGNTAAFSHNMQYMIEARGTSIQLYKHRLSTGTYEPIAGPHTNCNFGAIKRAKFDPTDTYIVFGHDGYNYADNSKVSVGTLDYRTSTLTCDTYTMPGTVIVNEIEFTENF